MRNARRTETKTFYDWVTTKSNAEEIRRGNFPVHSAGGGYFQDVHTRLITSASLTPARDFPAGFFGASTRRRCRTPWKSIKSPGRTFLSLTSFPRDFSSKLPPEIPPKASRGKMFSGPGAGREGRAAGGGDGPTSKRIISPAPKKKFQNISIRFFSPRTFPIFSLPAISFPNEIIFGNSSPDSGNREHLNACRREGEGGRRGRRFEAERKPVNLKLSPRYRADF